MTPHELMTRKLMEKIAAAGANVPVYSLLVSALQGEKLDTPSSGIAIRIHATGQLAEPQPIYTFAVAVTLTVSIDDDKGGDLFKTNHDAIWDVFDHLARADNCAEIGDEGDTLSEGAAHVFAVDGFQMDEGDDPDYQEDDNGGAWTISFAATITGRAT